VHVDHSSLAAFTTKSLAVFTTKLLEGYDAAYCSRSFSRRSIHAEDDEEALKWAALEKLPTYDRLRKSVLSEVAEARSFKYHDVDVTTLSNDTRKRFIE